MTGAIHIAHGTPYGCCICSGHGHVERVHIFPAPQRLMPVGVDHRPNHACWCKPYQDMRNVSITIHRAGALA